MWCRGSVVYSFTQGNPSEESRQDANGVGTGWMRKDEMQADRKV